MITGTVDQDAVHAALTLAARAPSVHNTQPWSWRFDGETIRLGVDVSRWLVATDPDGRDVLLSCGAWLHHLRVALAASDVGAVVHRLPDPTEPDLLAVVELRPGAGVDHFPATEPAASISRRVTDRRRFRDWPIPDRFLAQLVGCAADQGATLRVLTDAAAVSTVSTAIRTAAVEHAGSVAYGAELATWSGPRPAADGPAVDGVPVANTPDPALRRAGPPMRRFAGGELADPGTDSTDTVTLLVLGTSSDDRLSQLRAGEAMSAVLLRATTLGLGASPYSEPLEVPGTRDLLRDEVLGGTLSPQLVLRIGWPPSAQPPPPHTGRLPVGDPADLPR